MKILALTLSLALGACASGPDFNFPNMAAPSVASTIALRGSVGTMSSDMTATATVQKSRGSSVIDQETIGDDGGAWRGDVTYVYDGGAQEIGVFVGEATPSFGASEVQALDLGIVSRAFFNNESTLRPYLEARIGMRDMSAKGMVPGFSQRVESGTLFYGGAAVGLEYDLGGGAALHAQIDGSYAQGSLGSTDIMMVDYGILIGGSWRF